MWRSLNLKNQRLTDGYKNGPEKEKSNYLQLQYFFLLATEPLTYCDSIIVVVVVLRRGYNNRLNHLGT